MKFKNILVIGALPKDDSGKQLYESISSVSSSYGSEVHTPIETAAFQGTTGERYDRAFRTVLDSDLVIAEMSFPSTGQGMEIREAAVLKRPLVVVAKEGSKVSGLIKGCPVLKSIIYYSDLDDLKKQLDDWFKSY
ncbi:hypothetical protein HN419_01830 [Candidatus Woesearchaeota archaeon]|jgi:2'-deoxynucleoside 5'-phosphate N-hydrolase|nr:hypothetical protein [Candidatus Woesearchaeota archaeon]MBT3537264.1 hypothetical protein [Candidatus Woesearchaeota archaeon]MBT4698403.1 hypothetical protein [Candidatus Woesearchaeota archaeon]MBT7106426.1 hypothetical protein [Candidatus Woesearchaeota archaeon]MBT7931199.1 hypothetical protein [Candidatus Woesearchaeota archaeon]